MKEWNNKKAGRYLRRLAESWKFPVVEEQQCSVCGICQKDLQSLFVDHDHMTGQIIGLLCGGCNMGLGHLEDFFDRAIVYLKAGKESSIFVFDFPPKSKEELR